jgi:hypothetical protein
MRDNSADAALVATELCVRMRLANPKPMAGIHALAQVALKRTGRIGRVAKGRSPVSEHVTAVLGPRAGSIGWRQIFDPKTYRFLVARVAVWRAYAGTDPTAWVAISDTIDDIILNSLFAHDTGLGQYHLGSIGSVLNKGSRFARKYPALFQAVNTIHVLRLEADLAHPVTRATQMPTRRIRYRELAGLQRKLAAGFIELWTKW